MNTGIEILLKRMVDCPEDFDYRLNEGRPSCWMRLFDHAIGDEIATKEEREALEAGMKEVRRQRFTELVMKELAGVEDETSAELEDNFLYSPTSTVTLEKTTQGTWATGAIGTSAFDAQRYQTEMMRQQVDAMNKVQVRKKATIR